MLQLQIIAYVLNIVLNAIFILPTGVSNATLATLITETAIMYYLLAFCITHLKDCEIGIHLLQIGVSGVFMSARIMTVLHSIKKNEMLFLSVISTATITICFFQILILPPDGFSNI